MGIDFRIHAGDQVCTDEAPGLRKLLEVDAGRRIPALQQAELRAVKERVCKRMRPVRILPFVPRLFQFDRWSDIGSGEPLDIGNQRIRRSSR